MKKWALVVVLLYSLILLPLFHTVGCVIFASCWRAGFTQMISEIISGVLAGFASLFSSSAEMWWWIRAFLGLLVISQAVFLTLPVAVAEHRVITRQSLLWPTLASGLMAALLVWGAGLAIGEGMRSDVPPSLAWGLPALTWVTWGWAFWRRSRTAAAPEVISWQCRSLRLGSILELLVSVPILIIVRSRPGWFSGLQTLFGVFLGLLVILFSLGPGVFSLFAQRLQRLHPARKGTGPCPAERARTLDLHRATPSLKGSLSLRG